MNEDVQHWDPAACERGVRHLLVIAEDLERAYGRLDAAQAATYAAAGKGIIKTVDLGRVRRVSKEWLRNKINGEAAA